MDGLSLALMFHTSTSVGAGRLRNMASATHTVKSYRMDGWDDEAGDDEGVSHMFIVGADGGLTKGQAGQNNGNRIQVKE